MYLTYFTNDFIHDLREITVLALASVIESIRETHMLRTE